MNPRQAVAVASEIARQYPFSVHGLDFRITNDPTYPGSVILMIAEDDFSMFSDGNRLVLTEEILALAQLITDSGIKTTIEKVGTFND